MGSPLSPVLADNVTVRNTPMASVSQRSRIWIRFLLFSAEVLLSAVAIHYRSQNFGEYKIAEKDFVFHHGWNCLVYIAVACISLL